MICLSVLGGWQTMDNGILIGPVFNKISDLWQWQNENLNKNYVLSGDINDNWYDEQFELDVELEF